MNRITPLFAALLVIAGCATHNAATTPVAVKVTSETASNNFTRLLHDVTVGAIAQQVPNAHPMTVDLKLDVVARTQSIPSMAWSPQVNPQRSVATLSSQPWNDPAPPSVPVNTSAFQTERTQLITDYRVDYTITDAAGKVVDSGRLIVDRNHQMDPASKVPFSTANGLVGYTANFLASRVRTLSR